MHPLNRIPTPGELSEIVQRRNAAQKQQIEEVAARIEQLEKEEAARQPIRHIDIGELPDGQA